jgi:hypothetical protein
MASLDNIYDTVQTLDDSGVEYLLIAIQKGKKNGKADVFFNLKDTKSLAVLNQGLKVFAEQIDKIDKNDQEFN